MKDAQRVREAPFRSQEAEASLLLILRTERLVLPVL